MPDTRYELYHNPNCSKSRSTLKLLNERGIKPKVILYQQANLSKQDIVFLLETLEQTPRELIRSKDALFNTLNLEDASDDVLINAIVEHPDLLQRPILVVDGEKAAIGRPPANVISIL